MSNPIGGGSGFPGAWWKYYEEVERGGGEEGAGAAAAAVSAPRVLTEEERKEHEAITRVVQQSLLNILRNDGKYVEDSGAEGGVSTPEPEKGPIAPWKQAYRSFMARWRAGDFDPKPEAQSAESKPEDKSEEKPESSPKS